MRKCKSFFSGISRVFKQSKEYNEKDKAEICHSNYKMLRHISLIYLMLFSAYFIFFSILLKNIRLISLYTVFLAVYLIFTFFVFRCSRQKKPLHSTVQALCILFTVIVMAFIILVSIFPYPEKPALYFPTILVIIPVLFILPLGSTITLVSVFEAVFIFAEVLFKSGDILKYDIYSSVAAWIGSIFCIVIIFSLRVRNYNTKKEIIAFSNIDLLTGLKNKTATEQELKDFFDSSNPNKQCVLMLFDIDNFKAINDTYGHQCGDEALKKMGAALHSFFKSSDIVGRFGGDEFIALLPGLPETEIIKDKCQKIISGIKGFEFADAPELHMTCSIGAAVYDGKTKKDFESVFTNADKALYFAKKQGKNQYSIYH